MNLTDDLTSALPCRHVVPCWSVPFPSRNVPSLMEIKRNVPPFLMEMEHGTECAYVLWWKWNGTCLRSLMEMEHGTECSYIP